MHNYNTGTSKMALYCSIIEFNGIANNITIEYTLVACTSVLSRSFPGI